MPHRGGAVVRRRVPGTEGVRLAELMTALSLATDVGLASPFDHGQRSALFGARLAALAGLPPAEAQDAFYLSLLRTIGCTGDDDLGFRVLGEDLGEWVGPMAGASAFEALGLMVRNIGKHEALPVRVARVVSSLTRLPAMMANDRGHCEVGQMLARRLGLGPAVVRGLGQVFERWDGAGQPHHLRGEAIDRAVRLAAVATDTETAHHLYGPEATLALLRRRRGKGYDPSLIEVVIERSAELFAVWEVASISDAVLAAEPGPPVVLAGERLETAIRTLGEFGDLKSHFTRGHSNAVATLARAAGVKAGLADPDLSDLVRAAHVHDLGRAGIFQWIWDKPGALTEAEWERVRLHTYYTERILSRLRGLGNVPAIAALAHERLDGSGYHRRLPSSAVPLAARLLAAADAYQAMTETRPHREALSGEAAAAELRADAAAGKLDREAVAAVLAAAGHQAGPMKAEHPAGLSEREVEVLRVLARGKTNKEIAVALKISVKTAGNHVQHIFQKAGVTTRAAATLFAMQNDLLPPG
jgi:HD-GYP domain-containing protein (c-di-GMP phosphodiesterase class II)